MSTMQDTAIVSMFNAHANESIDALYYKTDTDKKLSHGFMFSMEALQDFVTATKEYQEKQKQFSGTLLQKNYHEIATAERTGKLNVFATRLSHYFDEKNKGLEPVLSLLHSSRMLFEMSYKKNFSEIFDDATAEYIHVSRGENARSLLNRIAAYSSALTELADLSSIASDPVVGNTYTLGPTLERVITSLTQFPEFAHLASIYLTAQSFKKHSYMRNAEAQVSYSTAASLKDLQYSLRTFDELYRNINQTVAKVEQFFVSTFKDTAYYGYADTKFHKIWSTIQNYAQDKDTVDSLSAATQRYSRLYDAYSVIVYTIVPSLIHDIEGLITLFDETGASRGITVSNKEAVMQYTKETFLDKEGYVLSPEDVGIEEETILRDIARFEYKYGKEADEEKAGGDGVWEKIKAFFARIWKWITDLFSGDQDEKLDESVNKFGKAIDELIAAATKMKSTDPKVIDTIETKPIGASMYTIKGLDAISAAAKKLASSTYWSDINSTTKTDLENAAAAVAKDGEQTITIPQEPKSAAEYAKDLEEFTKFATPGKIEDKTLITDEKITFHELGGVQAYLTKVKAVITDIRTLRGKNKMNDLVKSIMGSFKQLNDRVAAISKPSGQMNQAKDVLSSITKVIKAAVTYRKDVSKVMLTLRTVYNKLAKLLKISTTNSEPEKPKEGAKESFQQKYLTTQSLYNFDLASVKQGRTSLRLLNKTYTDIYTHAAAALHETSLLCDEKKGMLTSDVVTPRTEEEFATRITVATDALTKAVAMLNTVVQKTTHVSYQDLFDEETTAKAVQVVNTVSSLFATLAVQVSPSARYALRSDATYVDTLEQKMKIAPQYLGYTDDVTLAPLLAAAKQVVTSAQTTCQNVAQVVSNLKTGEETSNLKQVQYLLGALCVSMGTANVILNKDISDYNALYTG